MTSVIFSEKEAGYQDLAAQFQAQLSEKLMDLLDQVVSDRKRYFADNPERVPNKQSVATLIDSYALKNAAISACANLVPGPWGMLAVLPEIVMVIRNQIDLICDISAAYGKDKVVTKEIVAGILLTAMGACTGSWLIIRGRQVLVRRVSLRVFQRIVAFLGGKITQQALKVTISKWLPVVGVAFMALWSKHWTCSIGKKAVEIFEKDIRMTDDGECEDPTLDEEDKSSQKTAPVCQDFLRLQVLVNLIHIDGTVQPEEREFVEKMIVAANLTPEEAAEIGNALNNSVRFNADFTSFSVSPENTISLLMDMVTLARLDGKFHIAEQLYIKQVGKLLGVSESDISELMAATG